MVFKKQRRQVLTRLVNWFAVFYLVLPWPLRWATAKGNKQQRRVAMILPPPKTEGTVSVERATRQRRTTRAYRSQILSLHQLTQLLWSAQGITEDRGFKRAAPSAGALYPMDVYAVVGRDSVQQIEAGVYHYEPAEHILSRITQGDVRDRVAGAALSQMWMARAPINLVITAEYNRVTAKYGKRGIRYALIEAGHIGQNLFLQAEALGLKAGIVGAFHDRELVEILKIPLSHEPLLIMPAGYAV